MQSEHAHQSLASIRGLTGLILEGLVDELGRRVEELAQIEGGQVVCLHSVVLNGHVLVVAGPRVHVPPSVGCVEDMGEAGFLKAVPIKGCFPASKQKRIFWGGGMKYQNGGHNDIHLFFSYM